MERLEYDRYGGPEVVRLRPFARPEPAADDVLVRVAAASMNPLDWKVRGGEMKMFTGFRFPRAMGADFAGTVEAVGSRVSRFKPGDAVVGTVPLKNSGAFAPMLVTGQDLVVIIPDGLSFVEAACLPVAGVTAWQALVKAAGLRGGDRLLINGSAGAVGQAATAIARAIGVKVIGRIGPKDLARAPTLGLSDVLDYTQPLPSTLDRSFDVVFDAHGSLSIREGERLIRRGGRVIDIAPTLPKILRSIVSPHRKVVFADLRTANLQKVVDLAAAGVLSIQVARTVTLDDAPALLEALERGQRLGGKAVIAF